MRALVAWSVFVAVMAAGPASRAAGVNSKGGFVVTCTYSHTASDDPLVFPNQPGASHSHDFFGNTSTNASSTYQSMVDSPTTCGVNEDTAGYWVPTPSLAGVVFHPTGHLGDLRIYYRAAGAPSAETIPAGLGLIGGDKAATVPPPQWELKWYCGASGDVTTPFSSHPYDCSSYADQYAFVDGVVGVVDLPRCWDGSGLLPADVAYPNGGTGTHCPDGFGHVLPLVSERVHLGIQDPCGGLGTCGPEDPDTNVLVSFSSGPYYTLHADFWNTWRQETLDALVGDCVDAHVACGFIGSHYSVSVATSGTGGGTVTSDPAGLQCPPTCSAVFDTGTHVSLVATPDTSSSFDGWSGDCTGVDPCPLRMERKRSVTATFGSTGDAALSVTRSGAGAGVVTSDPPGIDCGDVCVAAYPTGTEVTLEAAADPSSVFAGWWGACGGTGSCVVAMNADESVGATFAPAEYRPDARIRLGRQHSFVGAGRYGTGGLQRVSLRVHPGGRGVFVVWLVNGGNVEDAYRVRGAGDRGPFRLRYQAGPAWGGITTDVETGRYVTGPVAPGRERSIRLVVDVARSARPGTEASWLVLASSTKEPTARDAVRAKVIVVRSG